MTKYVVVVPKTGKMIDEFKKFADAYECACCISRETHRGIEICRIPKPYAHRKYVLTIQ